MISVNDFRQLTFDKKCDFITVFADYLAHIDRDDKKCYLYSMDGFFVEVSYHSTEKRVTGIHAFQSLEKLDDCLENVSLVDIYNIY